MKMSKFEVLATVWSDVERKRVEIVVGKFNNWVNAEIFASEYEKIYSSNTEIVEYKRRVKK